MDFPGLADKSAVKSKQIIVFCNKPSTIPMVRVYIFIRKAYTEKPLLPVQKNQAFCRNRKNNYENDEIHDDKIQNEEQDACWQWIVMNHIYNSKT